MIKLCELKNNTRVKLTRYGFVVSGDKNDIAVTECTFVKVDGDRAVLEFRGQQFRIRSDFEIKESEVLRMTDIKVTHRPRASLVAGNWSIDDDDNLFLDDEIVCTIPNDKWCVHKKTSYKDYLGNDIYTNNFVDFFYEGCLRKCVVLEDDSYHSGYRLCYYGRKNWDLESILTECKVIDLTERGNELNYQ